MTSLLNLLARRPMSTYSQRYEKSKTLRTEATKKLVSKTSQKHKVRRMTNQLH